MTPPHCLDDRMALVAKTLRELTESYNRKAELSVVDFCQILMGDSRATSRALTLEVDEKCRVDAQSVDHASSGGASDF